jgi:hypothetical protein
MRSIVLLCGLAILLSGCADWTIDNWNAKQAAKRDIEAAKRDTEEDAKCQSSGGKPGDPAYDQCRAQLDAARTQAAEAADEFARRCSGPSTLPPCPLPSR